MKEKQKMKREEAERTYGKKLFFLIEGLDVHLPSSYWIIFGLIFLKTLKFSYKTKYAKIWL